MPRRSFSHFGIALITCLTFLWLPWRTEAQEEAQEEPAPLALSEPILIPVEESPALVPPLSPQPLLPPVDLLPATISEVSRTLYVASPLYAAQLEVFADYSYFTALKSSAFNLTRGDASLLVQPLSFFGVELTLETVRSAGARSLYGIDKNSFVMRLKRAYAYATLATPWVQTQLRGGLIPNLWLQTLQAYYPHQAFARTSGEKAQMVRSGDLGAAVVAQGIGTWQDGKSLHVGLSITNGEGINDIERNKRKDIDVMLSFVPTLTLLWERPLKLGAILGASFGSSGPADVRSTRLDGALVASHDYGSLGVEVHSTTSFREQPGQSALAVGGWLSLEPLPSWLGVVAHFHTLDPDTKVANDRETRLSVALYTDLGLQGPFATYFEGGVRLYAGYQKQWMGREASGTPGVVGQGDDSRFVVALSARGSFFYAP